jgi:hypothetical protein
MSSVARRLEHCAFNLSQKERLNDQSGNQEIRNGNNLTGFLEDFHVLFLIF